jgi:hypothetical protein
MKILGIELPGGTVLRFGAADVDAPMIEIHSMTARWRDDSSRRGDPDPPENLLAGVKWANKVDPIVKTIFRPQ